MVCNGGTAWIFFGFFGRFLAGVKWARGCGGGWSIPSSFRRRSAYFPTLHVWGTCLCRARQPARHQLIARKKVANIINHEFRERRPRAFSPDERRRAPQLEYIIRRRRWLLVSPAGLASFFKGVPNSFTQPKWIDRSAKRIRDTNKRHAAHWCTADRPAPPPHSYFSMESTHLHTNPYYTLYADKLSFYPNMFLNKGLTKILFKQKL